MVWPGFGLMENCGLSDSRSLRLHEQRVAVLGRHVVDTRVVQHVEVDGLATEPLEEAFETVGGVPGLEVAHPGHQIVTALGKKTRILSQSDRSRRNRPMRLSPQAFEVSMKFMPVSMAPCNVRRLCAS